MSITWATMKQYILEGILKDDQETRYTDTQLLAYARWACAELSQHTAMASTHTYNCDGVTDVFTLPSNLIDNIEKCGLVAHDDGKATNYLPVYKALPDVIWPHEATGRPRKCFWEWPTNSLTLGFKPSNGESIILYYFRIWTPPLVNTDLLEFPQWMEQPFVYLVAAAAMEPIGTQAANVRQWNRSVDSGNPEHNPAQKQAEWFVKQASRLLAKTPPQDRESFYQLDTRKKRP